MSGGLNVDAPAWSPPANVFSLGQTTADANKPRADPNTRSSSASGDRGCYADTGNYVPTFMRGGAGHDAALGNDGDEVAGGDGEYTEEDWAAEYRRVLALTESLIERQLHPPAAATTTPPPAAASSSTPTPGQSPKPSATATAAAASVPATPNPNKKASQGPKTAATAAVPMPTRSSPKPTAPTAAAPSPHQHHADDDYDDDGDSTLPPLTANGNRRWKKATKSQQKRETAQKMAFEAFAGALLHSVSPFMAPLRARCRTSLPHLKVDQRFGKGGKPETAIAQFIVAPLVTNYRPRHFHDLTPGDVLEYHYDLAQVLRQLPSAYALIIGYGPTWKRFAVPYCYVACRNYQAEVAALCPQEVPNQRSEPIYEDDIVKDITPVILSVEELEPLTRMSVLEAMRTRVPLAPLYDAFESIFAPLGNYQIEIQDLARAPSRFLLKASRLELDQKPQPIVLYNDETLWAQLPVVSRVTVQHETVAGEVGGEGASGAGVAAGKGSGDGKKTKKSKKAGGSNGSGVSLALVVPAVLSVLCVAATAGILLRKQNR